MLVETQNRKSEEPNRRMELQKSMRRQADIALSITKQLFNNENMVFSPFSLHAALSVMAAGSDGRTLDELLSFLRSDSTDHLNTLYSHIISAVFSDAAANDSIQLSFANGMWAHHSLSLSHPFKQLVATHYKATLASVDFQTEGDQVRREVNSWVEKETNGLITELLPPGQVRNSTRLIFANALHFKGAWRHKFDASTTTFHRFHLLNGTLVSAPFMKSKLPHFIRAFDDFKVLRLSYKQGRDMKRRFSMNIFLPNAKDGLSALIQKLASKSGFLEKTFPRRKVPVGQFLIPKFKISYTVKAADVLKELGVVSPFSQQDANFSKMVEANSKLYVDSIFHKAFIEVNEQGTEAAAATLVRAAEMCCSEDPPGVDFVANHPFLFLIREDFTGTVLFIGQVLNPLDGADPPIRHAWDNLLCWGNAPAAAPVKSYMDDDKPVVPKKRKMSSKR